MLLTRCDFPHRSSQAALAVRHFKLTWAESWMFTPQKGSEMILLSCADYEYYYDYATDSPAEDTDLNYGEWLFELLDVTGNPPTPPLIESVLPTRRMLVEARLSAFLSSFRSV